MSKERDPIAIDESLGSAKRYATWLEAYDTGRGRPIDQAQEEVITLAAEVDRLREELSANSIPAAVENLHKHRVRNAEFEAELKRYREREPLVQKLLEACGAFDARQPGTVYQDLAREDALLVRDFKLEGT